MQAAPVHDGLPQTSREVGVIRRPTAVACPGDPAQLLPQRREIQAKPALGGHPAALFLQQAQRAQNAACRVLLPPREARFALPFGSGFPEPTVAFRLLPQHASRPIQALAEQQGSGDTPGEIREARIERDATPSQ